MKKIFFPLASLAFLLTGCSPNFSPEEKEMKCADELRAFHKLEICDSLRLAQENYQTPTVDDLVRSSNRRANAAQSFYPFKYCSRYREITDQAVTSIVPECQ